MKNSKFVIDKISKLFEQGLVSSKDLANELMNICKSKRDEIVFRMRLTGKVAGTRYSFIKRPYGGINLYFKI